jgi:hypothetical protein
MQTCIGQSTREKPKDCYDGNSARDQVTSYKRLKIVFENI